MKIDDLKEEVNELETNNFNLTGLNQELRSEALDGIEIAKKVQDLTKERETLTKTLESRADSIK